MIHLKNISRKAGSVIVIVLVALIGISLYHFSHAATPSISVNTAEGSIAGAICTNNDTSASSGRSITFGCGYGTTTLPAFLQRASAITTYLADGVKPPTNQWFSNLAFKQPSDPVFAYPLALQTTSNGFGLSYPKVVTSSSSVNGSYSQDLSADFGPVDTRIAGYDDLSVNLEARIGASSVASYRLTQGSPIVYVNLKKGRSLTWTGTNAVISSKTGYYSLATNDRQYVISSDTNASATLTGSTLKLTATADAQLAVGVLPNAITSVDQFVAEMKDPITSTQVGYGASTASVTTSFQLNTAAGNGSLMALLPAQQTGTSSSPTLGSYQTVLGLQKLYTVQNYSFSTASAAPATNLDVSNLSSAEKSEVLSALKVDIGNLDAAGFTAQDTYFGGKQLARAANLMQLARNLGETTLAQTVYDKLNAQFSQWLNPSTADGRTAKYFYYDTNLKGLVGVQPSFGSDTEFNDHHFHYGYFLYAAGYMADFKPDFATKNASVMDAISRDIADGNRSDPYFPYLRPFDRYAGHAWASGTSPFADGNNNESSSEAVNAWYGLYLWAKASKNATLETQARWMYGRESNAALTYWTNFDKSQAQFNGYMPSIVSMVWGGKMEYSTWFSPSSYAKLGIQILPVTPASSYLGADKTRIKTNLSGLNDGSAPLFGDIMTMYQSLADPVAANAAVKSINDSQIDDGDSRSWLLAWVYSHNH